MANIQHTRNGSNLTSKINLSSIATTAGQEIRDYLAAWTIQEGDVILVGGTADFGPHYALNLPNCTYRGISGRTARWITQCKIDATTVDEVQTKPLATGGFNCGTFCRFENFYLGGECHQTTDDGGLISMEYTETDPCVLEFDNCEIDASRGFDWGIYSWVTATRTVTITNSVLRFCRIGVALPHNNGAQTVTLTDCTLYGDANGSKSNSETSEADNTSSYGGLLTPVLNRKGAITMTDCVSTMVGLREIYNVNYNVPRMVGLCTNVYASATGTLSSATVTRCRASYTVGTEEEWYDIDMRPASNGVPQTVTINYNTTAIAQAEALAAKWLAAADGAEAEAQATALGNKWIGAAKGGNAADGSMKVWTA